MFRYNYNLEQCIVQFIRLDAKESETSSNARRFSYVYFHDVSNSRRKILMKNSRDLPLIESSNRPNLISLIGCYSKFGNAHLEMRKEIGIRTKKCNIISLGMDSG